jgi:hypothetical protein
VVSYATVFGQIFLLLVFKEATSRDGVVGIATGYGLDDQVVRVPVGAKIFTSLSQRVKRHGSEADHSPPASADVEKMWIYTSTTPYAFMV